MEFVKLMPIDAAAALPRGSIDAFPVWEPYISQQIVVSGARPILTARDLMPGLSSIAANAASIEPRRAQIADFLGRLRKARAWVEAHRSSTPTSGRRRPISTGQSPAIGSARPA